MSSLFSSYVLEPVARRTRRHSSNPDATQQHRNQRSNSPAAKESFGSQSEASNSTSTPQSLREATSDQTQNQDDTHRLPSLDSSGIADGNGNSQETSEDELGGPTIGATRIPEVARENGFQGLIPLSDLRGDYLADDPPISSSFPETTHAGEMVIEPTSIAEDHAVDRFSSMSLDSGPPNRSSNPLYNTEGRLWSTAGSYDSMSRMSIDEQSRTSVEQPIIRSRDGSVSGGSTMSGSLPADDGMKELRAKIRKIHEMALSSEEKARRMHKLMVSDYKRLKPSKKEKSGTQSPRINRSSRSYHSASSVSMQDEEHVYHVKPRDLKPTYHPRSPLLSPTFPENNDIDENAMEDELPLGCSHYMRNIKVQCVDCKRWYPCRFCHDELEDHRLERKRIQNMLCMLCGTPQPAAECCAQCGNEAATYYCEICKLWDNDPRKRIYHCPDCGICRRGEGLGRDYFHCKRCNVCISIRWAEEHRCLERATECDCPICGEYMFTSSGDVVAVRCGHYMHKVCYKAYMDTNFRCPICGRSMVNMALQWRKLNDQIASQPMPEEFAKTQAFVSCNDCAGKSCVPYHWLGLKCATCDSYNTVRLRLIDAPHHEPVADAAPVEVTAADAIRSHSAHGQPSALGPNNADAEGPTAAIVPSSNATPPAQDRSENTTTGTMNSSQEPILIPNHAPPLQLAHSPAETSSTVIVSHHGDDGASISSGEPIMLDADNISTDEDDDDDDDDANLDFWGGRRSISPGWIGPPSWMSPRFLATRMGGEGASGAADLDVGEDGSSEGESMDDDDDDDDYDEDEDDDGAAEIDEMELFGHR